MEQASGGIIGEAELDAYLAAGAKKSRGKSAQPAPNARPPRSTAPSKASKGAASLPPPHIRVPAQHQTGADGLTSYERYKAAREGRSGHQEAAGLPWWAFVVADRCHRGRALEEVARLPAHLARSVRAAMDCHATTAARASVAALGCVLAWLSLRNPKRIGRPTNVGGIPQALLMTLTRRRGGASYSRSSVAHRSHTTGAVRPAETGEAGFLETLRQAGALNYWRPPSADVPAWMKGTFYAFNIFRVPAEPSAESGAERPPDRLEGLLGCVRSI
jgi:hypothetical protein